MKQKKPYEAAKAELIRFSAQDIITLSGFHGAAERLTPSTKSGSSDSPAIDWSAWGND